MTTFTNTYLDETRRIVEAIDGEAVERLAEGLVQVRERSGRLFILGDGGSILEDGDTRQLTTLEELE